MTRHTPTCARIYNNSHSATLWLADEAGHSLIEYALLLGLVAAALLFASEELHRSLDRSLGGFAAIDSHAEAAVEHGRQTNSGRRRVHQNDAQGDAKGPVAHSLLLTTVAICATGLAWRLRRRQPATIDLLDPSRADEPSLENRANSALFGKRQAILQAVVGNMQSLQDGGLEARHLMSRNSATVSPSAPLAACQKMMAEHRYRHLLVCDESGALLGVISDRDLARARTGRAEDIMTAQPLTVRPSDKICPAITMLLQRRISCLPVVEEGRLLGVLTTTDLLLALQCALQAIDKSACGATLTGERRTRTITEVCRDAQLESSAR
jgi:CBS domain-containing protein/Flp pilus assembly pilin Flp